MVAWQSNGSALSCRPANRASLLRLPLPRQAPPAGATNLSSRLELSCPSTMALPSDLKRVKRDLPKRIAQVRGARSQRRFALDLGIFQQNVNRYEAGTPPHVDFLITLALKEGISLDWLLLGKGRMRRGR